jgi:SET and MYND domain-containing protein 4
MSFLQVMFCGVDCMAAAETRFHGFECAALSSILNLDMGKMSLLAVRIVSVAGLDFLSEFLPSACAEIDIKTNEQKRSLGFNSTGKYDSTDLLPIFNLISNSEMRSVSDLFKRSMMSACLVKCLGLKSCEETSLIGSFLLRLLQSLPCNAHEISETIESDDEKVPINLEIGAAAYACLSLLNHSCDPNVVRHSHGNTAVLRAIKFIPKGEQILDNYGYHYAVHSKETRQLHLQSQYLFSCACEACSNSWPLHQNLSSVAIVAGSGELVVKRSSAAIQPIIQLSLNGEELSENEIVEIFKHLKVLDENAGRLCQEFNCCQEIIKQYFAKKGNFYSLLC